MIPGTGPGRGIPWWRWRTPICHRHEFGFGRETAGEHGRVIAVIGDNQLSRKRRHGTAS